MAESEKTRNKVKVPEEELARRVRNMLTTRYQRMDLAKVPWYEKLIFPLNDMMVDSTMYEIQETNKITGKKQTRLKDIFKPPEGQKDRPLRILMEGEPFSGKSTVAHKLLQDWATRADYMENYHLAFLLFPERIKSHDFELSQLILELCRIDNMEDICFQQLLTNRESHILIVVDNIENYNDEGKKDIIPLLDRTLFPKATVVGCGRTGVVGVYKQWMAKNNTAQTSVVAKYFAAFKDKFVARSIKWTKRLYVDGLSSPAKFKFLDLYLGSSFFVEFYIAHMEHLYNKYTESLYQYPAYLFYIARLNEESNFEGLKTRTRLFKSLLNLHAGLHHALGIPKKCEKCIDIFSDDKTLDCYRNVFKTFGELCWHRLTYKEITFTEEELVKNCSKLVMSVSLFKQDLLPQKSGNEIPTYRVLHDINAEFCIAYYLRFDQSQKQLESSILKLKRSFFQPKTNRWILLFLVGLLEEKAGDIVFKAMESYTFLYKQNFSLFLSYVQECQYDIDKVFDHLKVFLPVDWWIHWSQYKPAFARSELHHKLLELAFEKKWFRSFRWNMGMLAKIPSNVEVDKIELTINMRHMLGLNSFSGKRMICKELVVIFKGQGMRVNYERVLQSLNQVRTKTFKLYCNDDDLVGILPHLHYMLRFEAASELHIRCSLERFPKDFPIKVQQALEKNRTNYCTLSFHLNPMIAPIHFSKIDPFISKLFGIFSSSDAKWNTFNFTGDLEVPFGVPLESLSSVSDRMWSYIGLEWMQLHLEQFPLSSKLNVKHLMLNNVSDKKCALELLKSCSSLQSFTCNATDLTTWSIGTCSLHVAECESLHIRVDTCSANFASELIYFKGVKNLTLEFEMPDFDCPDLLKCLKPLSLSRLSFILPPTEFLKQFLKQFQLDAAKSLTRKSSISFRHEPPSYHGSPHYSFKTFHLDSPTICTDILPLQKKLLKNNVVLSLELSCWMHTLDFNIVETVWKNFTTDEYDITANDCDITKPWDPWPIWRHMLTIKRKRSTKHDTVS